MVSSTIPTSAWSHNCGMHVIADFLIEKLQQDDYKTVFTGQAYDALLKNFQDVYQQKDLTWESIRESCSRASRMNSQVILGIPLRMMLQNIIKNNIIYKEILAEQYLALLNLLIEEKYTEVSENYPILLSANKDYLMFLANDTEGFRVTEESLGAQKLQEQFNECGFARYCETIMAIHNENDELYHWLGISELTVICDYFEINPVINHSYEPSKIKKGPNLYFVNSDGLHWERGGDSNPDILPKTCDNIFYQEFIKPGNSHFIKNLDKIGQVFFSQKYLDLQIPQAVSLSEEMRKEFSQACVQGEHTVFSALIEKYKKHISITDENKNNLLHHLVLEYNNRNIQFLIKELFSAKIDLHAVNHKGYTPLHCAALKNNIFAIVELVRQGVVVDFVTSEGLSPCHISAIYNNKQAFNALKSLGASLSLEAYPNAINCLPFSWELDVSLTPLKIAEKTLMASAATHQKEHKIAIIETPSKKENKFSLLIAIKILYEFYLKNKNDRELCLRVQDDFFLKSEIELFILDNASLKIIDEFYQESFPEWIKRLIAFFEVKDANEIACENVQKIIDVFSIHACKAIINGKENKIIDCVIADYRCLFLSGKNSVLHHALKNDKYDFLQKIIYDFFKDNYHLEISENSLKERLDQAFKNASEKILDEYDRTLAFRLNRKKQYEELKQNFTKAKTIVERLKYRAKLSQHYAGDFNIYCVDKHHEKNKHSTKIQANKISKWGYPFMLALRSTGQIANGGMIRFGLEMAQPLLPNMVQLPFNFVGGKVGAYFGEKIGYAPITAEQYTKLAISNAISFALMPQYYVVSTVLSNAIYYAFKDTGYDNIEAVCQLAGDGIALSATHHASDKKECKEGEAYQYQLNKNLAPIFGESATKKYVAPTVTYIDNHVEKIDKMLSGHLNQYLSHSAIGSMANTMKETFSTPVEMLQNLQQYSNSWVESGFNLIEGNVLHYLMNDSKFKAERLYAIQLYNTHQLQHTHLQLTEQAKKENTALSKITSDLEEAQLVLTELSHNPDTPASVIHKQNFIISSLKEVFSRQESYLKKIQSDIATQGESINKALDSTQELYEKTEGYTYQEKWKDAYFAYKHSLFKPNRSNEESTKLLKEAEKALIDCQFYNTEVVNKMLDPWAKSVDDLFDRHKENFPDWKDPAHVIGSIVNGGFKNYSDRNQLARFLADEIIRLKYPLYPETGDKKEIEAERELLIHEISTDELSGYKRKPHRSKNRLYDYFIAKVTNTEKKRHQHRWEKACKPVANEILQKLVGWRPFKAFNGGEDGQPGRVGVQFTFYSDGTKNVQATLNDRPIAMLYESEKPALQLTAPERQATMLALPSNQVEASGRYNPAALTYANSEEIEITSGSSLNADNPYVSDYLAEQHADLCENIDKLSEKEEDITPKEKPAKSRNFESMTESAATPKPVVFSESAQAVTPHIPSLANSVFQGGVFSEASQNFPGPYSSENLPEKVKSLQPKKVFVPLGYQERNQQPTIPLRPEGQSIPELPKIVSPTQHKPQKPAQPKVVQPKTPKSSSPAAKPDLPKPQTESKPVSVPLEAKKPSPLLLSQPLQGFGYNPFLFQSKFNDISPKQFAGLAREAFGEYCQELADDVKILQREMLLGPSANITKISLTIGKYFGEELAHLFKNEKTKTRLFIEATKANFASLDEESQIKEVLKLGYSVVAPGTAVAAMGKAGILFKKINKLTNKASIPPVLPKSGQSLGQLTPITSELHGASRILPTSTIQSSNVPKNFVPAYNNEIKVFSVKSALDGALYPRDKLITLVNYLEKRGVHVYGTDAAPCFVVWRDNRSCQIYLPNNPTVLQVKHELSHWLDYKTLGKEKYLSLTRYEKEKLVLERLQENRLWDDLNKLEKDFSRTYVEGLNQNNLKSGVKNDK